MDQFLANQIIKGGVTASGIDINSRTTYETLIKRYGKEIADKEISKINSILILKGYPELVYK